MAEIELVDLITVKKAANLAGLHIMTIYRYVRQGKLLGVHIGNLLFVLKSEVEQLGCNKTRSTGDFHR